MAVRVIACATVIEEMLPWLPHDMSYEVLEFGLHIRPTALRTALQEAIDRSTAAADILLLGYGLCALAIVGLEARRSTLVVPRADDCVGLFLGSRAAYREQVQHEAGTYYLTKGWIEVGDTPFSQFEVMVQRYGEERARRILGSMLKNYRRLALINTGQYAIEHYRAYARAQASKFGLHFEEIRGSPAWVKKLVTGPWDDEFVVVPPGGRVTYDAFRATAPRS